MTQFLRDQASDSEEVVTPLMLDGTYLSRNFATLGPLTWQPPCLFYHLAAKSFPDMVESKMEMKERTMRPKLPQDAINPAHGSLLWAELSFPWNLLLIIGLEMTACEGKEWLGSRPLVRIKRIVGWVLMLDPSYLTSKFSFSWYFLYYRWILDHFFFHFYTWDLETDRA